MRDLIVVAIVLSSIPYAFRRPFIGLMMFSWLAYMVPEDLCWGIARSMRFSFMVALTMFIGFFANDMSRRPFMRKSSYTMLIVVLGVLVTISLYVKAEVIDAHVMRKHSEFLKILLVAAFTTGQVDSKQRLRLILWVIALSLGFYGFKLGMWGVLTGGAKIRHGPGGFLYDNNDFALAMVMNLPLLFYLGRQEEKAILRRFCDVTFVLTCITVVLTHSRGGFLALVVVALFLAYRTGKLFRAVLGLGVAGFLFLWLTPDHVWERLATIKQGTEEASAGARWRAWQAALRMVEENPVLGVGLRNFQQAYYEVAPDLLGPGTAPVAHNSYLQIWAEAGTPAFLVYLSLIALVFRTTRRIRRASRDRPEFRWAYNYSRMFEVTLVGFCVGAVFINRGHFDLLYHWMALVAAMRWIFDRELAAATSPSVAQAQAPTAAPQPVRIRPRPVAGALPVWGRTT